MEGGETGYTRLGDGSANSRSHSIWGRVTAGIGMLVPGAMVIYSWLKRHAVSSYVTQRKEFYLDQPGSTLSPADAQRLAYADRDGKYNPFELWPADNALPITIAGGVVFAAFLVLGIKNFTRRAWSLLTSSLVGLGSIGAAVYAVIKKDEYNTYYNEQLEEFLKNTSKDNAEILASHAAKQYFDPIELGFAQSRDTVIGISAGALFLAILMFVRAWKKDKERCDDCGQRLPPPGGSGPGYVVTNATTTGGRVRRVASAAVLPAAGASINASSEEGFGSGGESAEAVEQEFFDAENTFEDEQSFHDAESTLNVTSYSYLASQLGAGVVKVADLKYLSLEEKQVAETFEAVFKQPALTCQQQALQQRVESLPSLVS